MQTKRCIFAFGACSIIATTVSLRFALNQKVENGQQKFDEPFQPEKKSTQPDFKSAPSPRLRLAHVFTLYQSKESVENQLFYPLDQAQNVTAASVVRARNKANFNDDANVNVTIYSPVFDDERHVVPPHSDFATTILKRSTRTEYPEQVPDLRLPFLQDMIDSAVRASKGDFDYLIFTNSDIGLHEKFYEIVAKVIRENESNYDVFSINRIVLENVSHPSAGRPLMGTTPDLELIYRMMHSKEAQMHPGIDCIIFSKQIIQLLDFGDLFAGYPPWCKAMGYLLRATNMTKKDGSGGLGRPARFLKFRSRQLRATFHLGKDNGTRDRLTKNKSPISRTSFDEMVPCRLVQPRKLAGRSLSFHMEQNIKNCATMLMKYELPPEDRGLPWNDHEYNDAVELQEKGPALLTPDEAIERSKIAAPKS